MANRSLNRSDILEVARKLVKPYRITDGSKFRLKDIDPSDTGDLGAEDKPKAKEGLQLGVQALSDLQDMLYAQDRWGVLIVFQAMDAAGKDGAIKHVMSGVNPQGCQVASFKSPSSEELDHDYLWRCNRHLPERGRIGIFNRSYYEEVLVVRVHKEFLANQRLPAQLTGKSIWKQRLQDIRRYEKYLGNNGVVVRKIYLHLSKKEQKRRFLERLDNPEKNWKFSSSDIKERQYWDEYMEAYEQAIQETATPAAPWYVIPADNKWFTRIIVAAAVIETLCSLDLAYPSVSEEKKRELEAARQALLAEG